MKINWEKDIDRILHIIALILSIYLVLSISIDTFRKVAFLSQPNFIRHEVWICLFFMAEFLFELIMSPRKWHYLSTHFLFLLVSIPYLAIFDYYKIAFSPEIHYFIRFIPLVRGGYALAIVVSWLTSTKASSLFLTYLTTLLSSVYFFSLIFFVLEHKVNPLVSDYQDALWWAFMDVTTVGSNIYAVTGVGKVMSVVLAALGMMMFPIFTVFITSIISKKKKDLIIKSSDIENTSFVDIEQTQKNKLNSPK